MGNIQKIRIKVHPKRLKIIAFSLVIMAIFVFSFCYLNSKNIIFPCINGFIMLVLLFVCKSKYRIYSIIFFTFIPPLLSINGYSIPSFVSINLIVYFICILVETIIKIRKKSFSQPLKNSIVTYLILSFFLGVGVLVNIQTISLVKSISTFCYFSLPMLFILDRRAEKKTNILLLVFCIGILLSNLFSYVFIYVFKQYSFTFLEMYIPGYVNELKYAGYSGFRFPGLVGDSNHNSLNILLASSLVVLYSIKNRKTRLPLIILAVLIQFFAIIGGSKTYIICLFLLLFAFLFYYFFLKKQFLIGTSFVILFFSIGIIFFLNIGLVSTSILRLLNVDTRGGFLESLTTGRLSVWKTYLVAISDNPIAIIFGHGISSPKLNDFHFHSVWIELLWDFGIITTLVFFYYFYVVFLKPLKGRQIIVFFPFSICLFFGLTLHILYDEFIYFGLLTCVLLSNDFSRKEQLHLKYAVIDI